MSAGRRFIRLALALSSALVAGRAALAEVADDPVAAESQYRLAQRLTADGSPDAAGALAKVVTLAPHGPYADDALVDLARIQGAPDWPEDLGAIDATHAALARTPLENVAAAYADGDRALEARYLLALLRCAPVPGRDPARARDELIALAAVVSRETWPIRARYALGLLDEQAGHRERSAGAYARIVVERPDSDVAPRAQAAFGRTLLAAGRFGEAADWCQRSLDRGGPSAAAATALRDLAVRELLRARSASRQWAAASGPLPAVPTSKGAALLAAGVRGRLIVFDRKADALQSFEAQGAGGPSVALPGVTAIATDPFGRVYAATKDALVRWDASGPTTLLTLGAFGAPSAIAVDASGSVWVVDRKGDRVGRWAVGSPAPSVVYESKGAGLAALVVAGSRAIAAEEKTGRLVAIPTNGPAAGFGGASFKRPGALALDAAGRVTVLDLKAETLTRLDPSGAPLDTLALDRAGVSNPLALASTADGRVLVLQSGGAVAVSP